MLRQFLSSLLSRNRGLLLDEEYQDSRDFVLGAENTVYRPNHIRKVIDVPYSKDQTGQNTCVCESGAVQKENDEAVELDPQDMAIFLRSVGQMWRTGTSLSLFQKALRSRGIAERGLLPNNYKLSWEEFSHPKQMTKEIELSAAKHKSKSYYKTYSLNTVLEMIDRGKIGQTGGQWYSGYNQGGGFRAPWIISPFKGRKNGGHAWAIIGYDLNYRGEKVLVCQNSFGKRWADGNKFYIRFRDFSSVCSVGVYYNEDMTKDTAGWLSIHSARPVLEYKGNKVYLIQSDRKRHIPDEAMLAMLDFTPQNIVHDKENIMAHVKEGEPVTLRDIPRDNVDRTRYMLQFTKNQTFTRDRFKKYFPDLF